MKDVEQIAFTTYENDGIYHIQCSGFVPGPGHVYATLIVGEEKAFLFDTGFGDDDLADFVKSKTGKELITVLSHVHFDHAGGVLNFSDVWIPESEQKELLALFPETSYDPGTRTLGSTRLHFLKGDEVFDLGGRTVSLIPTPGHTRGSLCAYDSRTKLLLSGDTLSRRVFLFTAHPAIPLSVYRDGLVRLLQLDFEEFLPGHDCVPNPRSWFDRMIGMVDSFTPDKGKAYERPDLAALGGNLKLYVVGRGFGDPDYCGFAYSEDDLPVLLQK